MVVLIITGGRILGCKVIIYVAFPDKLKKVRRR
jgi:hypothetical protein